MSIYGTTFYVGDPDDPDGDPGVVLIRDGGTNHWPSPERNRRGSIDGAAIPSWCVPGHPNALGAPGYEEPGGWYRLGACSVKTVPEFPDEPPKFWRDQEYLLDEDAARALRDDLTRWIDLPKTRPAEEER